jgi:hypothetical protein
VLAAIVDLPMHSPHQDCWHVTLPQFWLVPLIRSLDAQYLRLMLMLANEQTQHLRLALRRSPLRSPDVPRLPLGLQLPQMRFLLGLPILQLD